MFGRETLRVTAPLTALLIVGTGCSDESEELPSRPSPPSEAAVSPIESEDPGLEEVEELHTYCWRDAGEAYPRAAEYSGEGPHTIAMFRRNADFDTELPSRRLLRTEAEGIFDGWTPEDPDDIALLACIEGEPTGGEPLKTCEYSRLGLGTNVTEVPLYGYGFEYTVYELRTGEIVASDDLPLSEERICPITLPSDIPEPSEAYTGIGNGVIQDALKDLVEGDA